MINSNDAGIDSWQPSFQKYALENQIQIITLEQAYTIKNLIFISLEFDKIIKPSSFKTKYLYNMHFSLLPKYKGMYTAVLPLINGESKGGVTFHLIDEGIDTGDIVDYKAYAIDINDTARDLYFKNLKYSFELFKKVIKDVLNGSVKTKRQSHLGASYYSKKAINFENINVDFNKTSFEIHNQIRAFIFPEYQLPKIDNKEIYKCILTNEKIKKRKITEKERFIISGIDGFKIIAYFNTLANNYVNVVGGGGLQFSVYLPDIPRFALLLRLSFHTFTFRFSNKQNFSKFHSSSLFKAAKKAI